MLGTIIGDIAGSIYEFHNHKSKDFSFFGDKISFTDDSVCTIALANALLSAKDPAIELQQWCSRYPARGYGGKFLQWIYSADLKPYNSYGNGAAMRVSSAAWLGASLNEALCLADKITEITHNHPEGLRGARATCHAIYMALSGSTAEQIRTAVQAIYNYDLSQKIDDIRTDYRFDESCQGTVPQALTCALNADSFEDAIRNAISIGGDSDTVPAIAGSVAGPLFGIPQWASSRAMGLIPQEFSDVIARVQIHHSDLQKTEG